MAAKLGAESSAAFALGGKIAYPNPGFVAGAGAFAASLTFELSDFLFCLRIPVKLDSDSEPSWTRIPEQAGQSERSDAGFLGFTLKLS